MKRDLAAVAGGGEQPRRRRPEDYRGVYEGRPRWDIGRPQPALLAVAEAGGLAGHVLDVGCGTGEHALMAAERGFAATGIDTAPVAIGMARRKAAERGLEVQFEVANATALRRLRARFRTVLDSGLFHVLDDHDRTRFAAELAAVVPPGGRYHLLCFSDRQPGDDGPRRISRADVKQTFGTALWELEVFEASTIATLAGPATIAAWLATLRRR